MMIRIYPWQEEIIEMMIRIYPWQEAGRVSNLRCVSPARVSNLRCVSPGDNRNDDQDLPLAGGDNFPDLLHLTARGTDPASEATQV